MIAVVVGVGPGLGGAVARRFAREGYSVACVARSEKSTGPVCASIVEAGGSALAVHADTTDPDAVTGAIATIREQLGDPSVLIYNAGSFVQGEVSTIEPDAFVSAWKANCFGAFLWTSKVVPILEAAGSGTIILTGATASLRGSAGFSGLAVGKFGLRALSQSLARELGPKGIHVAHTIIDGMIDLPRTRSWMPDKGDEHFLDPEGMADAYWFLHSQAPRNWTQELDLRPAIEKF